MNAPKSLELAMLNIVRQHCELGDNVLVRAWQSLNEDGSFNADSDRHFPCVDIRFAAPQYNEDQVTLVCLGQITTMTYTEDDVSHQSASEIFDSTYAAALAIFRGACEGKDPTLYNALIEYVAELDDGAINIGGITLENGMPPADDAGLNEIGVGIGVHFTYT